MSCDFPFSSGKTLYGKNLGVFVLVKNCRQNTNKFRAVHIVTDQYLILEFTDRLQ